MTAECIEFSLVFGEEDGFPRPYPANKEIPEWFRSMPTVAEGHGTSTRTVKNCTPFIEAMTCGYIIPLAADIRLSLDQGGVYRGECGVRPTSLISTELCGKILQIHPPASVQGAPFEGLPVVKILNPWLIRTSPGHSTLFLPLLNRLQMPLLPLAGLVETDSFYREVSFPAVLMIPRGSSVTLPRGTPLVQAIPIKREEFQSEFVPADVERYHDHFRRTRDHPDNYNFYKDNFWEKKTYR